MPLIVIAGAVKYRRPKKQELPVIGSAYQSNEIYKRRERDKQCSELSDSMSRLQEALLKGNKNV